MPQHNTRSQRQDDEQQLLYAAQQLLQVPTTNYNGHEVARALAYNGITTWNDFLTLSERNIETLTVDGTRLLSLIWRRKMIILLALHHHISRERSGQIAISAVNIDMYNAFRTSTYDPTKPIIPWMIPLPSGTTLDANAQELATWKKTVKPSRSDFKTFKEEVYWSRFKQSILVTLDAQGLSHLVDPNHTVTNQELDSQQQKWLYKTFQDIMLAPMAKTIVINHLSDKNTRNIWTEMTDHYDSSLVTQLRAQSLSTYLTSNKHADSNWRGSTTSYISHFQEQCQLYNEISSEPFTNNQLTNFLEIAVSKTEGLNQVLRVNRAARQAAGITTVPTFEEYVGLLIDAATMIDNSRTSTKNPRSSRSANVHEYIFDGEDEPVAIEYEAQAHDIDTPVEELLVMQTDSRPSNRKFNGPFQPRLDHTTWDSLASDDQTKWDEVSNDGKGKILGYVKRKTLAAAQNQQQQQTRPPPVPKRSTNTHELGSITEDTPQNSNSNPLEVSIHQQRQTAKQQDPIKSTLVPQAAPKDLLTMATQKTTAAEAERHLSINHVLSQGTKKQVKFHKPSKKTEVSTAEFMPRSPFTPYEIDPHGTDNGYGLEINSHEFDYSKIPLQSEYEQDDDSSEVETDGNDLQASTQGTQTQTAATLIDFSQIPLQSEYEQDSYETDSGEASNADTQEAARKDAPLDLSQLYASVPLLNEDSPDLSKLIEGIPLQDQSKSEESFADKNTNARFGQMSGIYKKVSKPEPMKDRVRYNHDMVKFQLQSVEESQSNPATDLDDPKQYANVDTIVHPEPSYDKIPLESQQIDIQQAYTHVPVEPTPSDHH